MNVMLPRIKIGLMLFSLISLLSLNHKISVAMTRSGLQVTYLHPSQDRVYLPILMVGYSYPAEVTLTPSATQFVNATSTRTVTPTQIPSSTLTRTPTPIISSSSTPTRTITTTSSPSYTPTRTMTSTPTASANPTSTRQPSATATSTQSVANDPILYFVCDLVSAGSTDRAQAVVSLINKLMGQHPGAQMLVASGGDNEQENSPTLSNYQSNFGTTFATFVNQHIFMQVRGNHDNKSMGSYKDFDGTYHSTGAAYWDYFGINAHMANIENKKLTDYSYDLGTWHIIAIDQILPSVVQPSLDFLTSDLAAHRNSTCQLVYWHVPTYSSGIMHGDSLDLKPFNQVEYNAGVDVQLNGHDHDYQRFYPINPSGVRDNTRGITTFVAGIGGEDSREGSQKSAAQVASAIYLDRFPGGSGHAIGVVQFILHANSADYALFDANNGAILDQGTVVCH